jgi:glutamate carboxypeptidase
MRKSKINNISEYLTTQKERMTEVLEHLVLMETPTVVPESQQAILQYLKEQLESLGFYTFQMPGKVSGGYLVARPKDRLKHQPIQLLVGHCDTVWPIDTLKTMPWKGGERQN